MAVIHQRLRPRTGILVPLPTPPPDFCPIESSVYRCLLGRTQTLYKCQVPAWDLGTATALVSFYRVIIQKCIKVTFTLGVSPRCWLSWESQQKKVCSGCRRQPLPLDSRGAQPSGVDLAPPRPSDGFPQCPAATLFKKSDNKFGQKLRKTCSINFLAIFVSFFDQLFFSYRFKCLYIQVTEQKTQRLNVQ